MATRTRAADMAVEHWLWTILAVGLVLGHAGDLPVEARHAGALAEVFALLGLFVAWVSHRWAVA